MDYKRKEVFLMGKKSLLLFMILMCGMLFGCGKQKEDLANVWIPATEKNEDTQKVAEEEGEVLAGEELYTSKKLATSLIIDPGRTAADILWGNQKVTAVYRYNKEEHEKGKLLIYYISSSEGDDSNDGLSPERPKKSLDGFSNISNINLLLKCGDTFHMKESFEVGSNVIFATYGEGPRPILDFYQPLKVKWSKSDTCPYVWYADLKNIPELNNEQKASANCNIGHLLIDGEHNWRRKIKENGQDFGYGEYLTEMADDSFAVDAENSKLYLYSKSDPANMEISYALPVHGVKMNNVRGSQILGIEITGVGFHAISLSGVVNVKIQSCYIHHIGGGLLSGSGPRYGNAVEIWDSGQDVVVSYNIADWIFDTCYTNQGSSGNAMQKNILFSNNIGRYSFWGIETWGDGYAEAGFEQIVYKENILMNACDVTAPEGVAFCNEEERLINGTGNFVEKQEPYVSYRGTGYNYHQMCLLNASDNKIEGELIIDNNVFWGTKRFLCMFGKKDQGRGFPLPENNLFYSDVPTQSVCLFRVTDTDGTRHFLQQLPLGAEKNTIIANNKNVGGSEESAKTVLYKAVEKISKGSK